MTIKVAVIGLGIMGRRMLEHMQLHSDYEPDYLWDPEENACKLALKENPQAHIMENPSDAIQAADLVYLACSNLNTLSKVCYLIPEFWEKKYFCFRI